MKRSSPRKAFTLIELLVVIAIIAILAAILFPVFAQAKAAAKKTTAISNCKEINLGSLMYSNDYDDNVVPYFVGIIHNPGTSPIYTAPQEYWPQVISPYVQKATGHGVGGMNGTVAQAIDTDLSGIFFDPIKPFTPQAQGTAYGNIVSWGISDDLVNAWCPSNPTPVNSSFIPVNNGSVVAPADTISFTETWDWLGTGPGAALAMSFFDDGVYQPGVTVGWLDGAQLTLDSPYQASYQKTSFYQEPDPNGVNVTGFCDGHTKAVHTNLLTHAGTYWSIGNNDLWP
jgi:prepilin-type N-terminal cleavage/methylation domain-containing protein